MEPAAWSVSRLAAELRIDRRTLARRLEGVAPSATGPKGAPMYALRVALDALGRSPVAAPGCPPANASTRGGRSGAGDDAWLIEVPGALATLSGDELCTMLCWNWRDLSEALGWGLPFLTAGDRKSPSGWLFAPVHFTRALAALADRVHSDLGNLPHRLRQLRGARELVTPTGFYGYSERASKRERKNGAHDARSEAD